MLTDCNRWHILTAVGGYIAVAVVDMITTDKVTEDPLQRLAWPVPSAINLLSAMRKPQKTA